MKIINHSPLTVEEQDMLIGIAAKSGIKKYVKRIDKLVGDYDKAWVTEILSNTNEDMMIEAYADSDTMVREYVMEVINWK